MSFLALGLFVLACGWKLYKDWLLTRYSALKNSGHPQYFAAALFAAYLFVLAVCVDRATRDIPLRAFLIEVLGAMPYEPSQVSEAPVQSRALGVIAFWVAVLTLGLGWAFNRPMYRSEELLLSVASKVGALDRMERLIIRCIKGGLLTAITLSSGKVYAGIPLRGRSLDQDRVWLEIWPFASGYRTNEGALKLTTYYQPQYDAAALSDENELTEQDFAVVIPISQIVSAQSFDLPTYHSFGKVQGDPKEAPPLSISADSNELLRKEIITESESHHVFFYYLYVSLISFAVVSLFWSCLLAIVLALLAVMIGAEAMHPYDAAAQAEAGA